MSLALSTLIYEWRRYFAAVISLAFAGMLVLVEVGFFAGIIKTATASVEKTPAQIYILPKRKTSLINGSNQQPARIKPAIYMHPEVVEVVDTAGSGGLWQSQKKSASELAVERAKRPENMTKEDKAAKQSFRMTWASLRVVDPVPGSLTLPSDFTPEQIQALRQPYGVLVDVTDKQNLGINGVGDRGSVNGKTVTVVGFVSGYGNAGGGGKTVFVSRQTLRLISPPKSNKVGALMVRIKDPTHAEQVRDDLNKMAHGRYRAWTKAELSKANAKDLLKEPIISIMLNASLVLSTIIGVIITWQTLQGAILANIKEFAGLRALGVPMGKLRATVFEISFWVGIFGLGAAALLVLAARSVVGLFNVPMEFPADWIITTGISLMLTALFSGFFSLGVLNKGQPADLLK